MPRDGTEEDSKVTQGSPGVRDFKHSMHTMSNKPQDNLVKWAAAAITILQMRNLKFRDSHMASEWHRGALAMGWTPRPAC